MDGAGVYFFLSKNDAVLYVGKAGDLRQRLRRHAAVRAPESRLHQRYDLVRRVAWEIAADEEAALRFFAAGPKLVRASAASPGARRGCRW